MKTIIKNQVNKLPISRLVLPATLESEQIETDESGFIAIELFRTRSYFPTPFYKNISRKIPLSPDENI